jgi:hypothetical protein
MRLVLARGSKSPSTEAAARPLAASLPEPDTGGHRIRGQDMARIRRNQQSAAGRAAGARRLPLRLSDQPRRRHSPTLSDRTKRSGDG